MGVEPAALVHAEVTVVVPATTNVAQVAKLDVQRIVRLRAVDAIIHVPLDAGTHVQVLPMHMLLFVEHVIMVVHITVAHHLIKVVMVIVHGVVLYAKIIVHQIAVSHALKLSKAF